MFVLLQLSAVWTDCLAFFFIFQCYRQVTHQINLELICSLFESGGIEINVQVTVVLLRRRFKLFGNAIGMFEKVGEL